MNFPDPLSRAQEDVLVKKGTKKSLEKLVLHNMTEAVVYARHVSRGSMNDGELVSACWLALRSASSSYCCRHISGIRFFAFAKQALRGQISAERKRARVVRNAEHESLDGANDNQTVEPDYSNIESAELLAGLRPAMFEVLSDRERAILILRYSSGFSFTEIGDRIGFSRQSIQKNHCKALEKLRGALQTNQT